MMTNSLLRSILIFLLLASAGYTQATVELRSDLRQVHAVAPGTSQTGSIVLHNVGDEVQVVRVTQTDYTFNAEGNTDYGEAGMLERSNANWISVSTTEFEIGPGERYTLAYQVAVPEGILASGSYWSIIMLEPGNSIQPEADTAQETVGFQFRPIVRYAVQIVTDFDGTGSNALEFDNPQIFQNENSTVLTTDLFQHGELMTRPEVFLELYNQAGELVGRFESQLVTLFPDTSVRKTFDLGALTEGDYVAVVLADAGGSDVFGVRYNLNVTASNE
jgi:hypothetical protein